MGVLRSRFIAAMLGAALLSPHLLTTAAAQPRPGTGPSGYGHGYGIDPRDAGQRGGYQDPAYARGYSDGYARGESDGRAGERYDPVGEREYRDGDSGYSGSYGSRDAYRSNYRAGFRQGYESGYRDGQRSRR